VRVDKEVDRVSLWVFSEADVRRLLDMESCIEAMTEVLSSLAREELFQPLRVVVRPPADELLGLMPAWRGGRSAVFSLKEIVISPGNSARGLDPHQGAVLLHDGVTGQLRALLNASAITEIRTAAVSAVATRALARPDASVVAILGSGVQGRAHVDAMRAVLPDAELRIWSRTAEHATGLALRSNAAACGSVQEALEGAHVVCTTTSAREPILQRGWLAPGAHVNAVGSSVPWARELDVATVVEASLFVDRRESTVNESGDYLTAVAEAGIDAGHIRAELGEVLIGAHPGRTDDTELTLFKSLGLAVEDLAAAELCVLRAAERGVGTEVDF
jgi:ornithine cyclodeaminase/alanine dehydrogenase-like protein (mu-crystallin family)